MVSSSLSLAAIAVVAAATWAPSVVNAHGFLVKPKATFKTYGGGYSAIVQSSTLTPPTGKQFIWFQDQIAGVFHDALEPTGLSLRDFILKNQDTSVQAEGAPKPLSAACGFSDPNGTPQTLPDQLQWEMGFLHPGPCEVYCDDELVVPYTTDCWNTYKDNVIPYEKAKCAGKKQLTLYFLAVHYPPWQVYINCVPLSGASASAGNSTTRTPIPASTTRKPAAATPKPIVATPKPNTKAPTTNAPATKAPSKSAPLPTTKPSPMPTPADSETASEATEAPDSASSKPTPAPTKDKICVTKSNRKLKGSQ